MLRSLSLILPLALLVPPHGAQAQQGNASNLVVILDGSGSMWGRVGTEPKITAAKRVMDEILSDVPRQVRLGFVAYGHRRKGDCRDIETVGGLGTPPGQIAAEVRRITPTGKTPITDALRQAAGVLDGTDAPSTIVLVSDGIETCQGDPCALAKELKAGGINLRIHTVGFGVGDAAARQLQCIAKAGGGNYYQADSGAALRSALFEVRKAVAQNKAPASVKPVTIDEPETPTTKRIKITGPGTIKLQLASWAKLPYRWTLVHPETGEELATANGVDSLKVRAGEYQIVWRQLQHNSTDLPLTEVVAVPAGKSVTLAIDTGLQLVPPQGLKAPYRWGLAREGEDETFVQFSGPSSLDPQVLPAGAFRLIWHQHQHDSAPVELGEVSIEAGQLNQVALAAGIRILRAEWLDAPPYRLSLVGADGKVAAEWRRGGATGVQLAPPGTYQVRYQQTQHDNTPIDLGTITVPETGFADIKVNTGVKFIPSAGAKTPYQAIFVNLDTKTEYVWYGHNNEPWKPVPLPPGRYRLDWWEHQHNSQRITLVDEFELQDGVLAELEM